MLRLTHTSYGESRVGDPEVIDLPLTADRDTIIATIHDRHNFVMWVAEWVLTYHAFAARYPHHFPTTLTQRYPSGARSEFKLEIIEDRGGWLVFEFEVMATATIEGRFQVVAHTVEEARSRMRMGDYDNYFLPAGVEAWQYIATEFVADTAGAEVTASTEAQETLEGADLERIAVTLAEMEE